MTSITLISILLTIIVYIGAKFLSIRIISPLTTPLLTSAIAIITVLYLFHIPYEQYVPAKKWFSYILGPATVSLAVPMYHNRSIIMEKLKPALFSLTIGTLSSIISAVWISKWIGLSEAIQATSTVKAVTTPVAVEVVKMVGGDPALASAFVVITGVLGAVIAPTVLTWFKISDPFARGLAIGTASHAIGTSQAIKEGSIQGAVSSMAMGIAAVITSIVLPWLFPFL